MNDQSNLPYIVNRLLKYYSYLNIYCNEGPAYMVEYKVAIAVILSNIDKVLCRLKI